MQNTFAAWLTERMTETRISQSELNRLLGQKSNAGLSWHWVHDNAIPNPDYAEMVIQVLAVPGTEEAVRLLILRGRAERDEALAEYYRERTPEFDGFAGWLAETLRERGMSRSQLARRLDVSYLTVNRWAQQRSQPSADNRVKVAEIFGVPLVEIPSDADTDWFTEYAKGR